MPRRPRPTPRDGLRRPRRGAGRARGTRLAARRAGSGRDPDEPPVPAPDPAVVAASPQGARRPDRQGPQPGAGARRHDDRGPAADPRRRRVGQDPRPGAPDRLPGRRQGRRRRGGSSRSRSPTARRPSCASGSSAWSARAAGTCMAGTFHSLCARVLRQDGEAIGIGRRFVIYDTDDQQALMKQILREEDLPLTGEFRPSAVLGAISRAKNEMLDPTFLVEHAANHRERTIARLATRYQERLRKANALDFDDLLLEAVRLFEEAPEVLAKYQEQLALPPRRRVPGHEPRAVPVGAGAGREAPQPRAWSATTTSRSTRGAAPTCATSSTSSATGPTTDRRQARAELPLDAADPRRGACGRLAQQRAQGQEALDRERGRPADPALRGLQRGGGGRVDRPPGRGPGRRTRQRAHPSRRRRRGRTGSGPATSRSCTG